MEKPGNLADVALGAIFAALGLFISFQAMGLRTIPGMPVGPSLFPTATGFGMLAFGLVLAVQGWLHVPAAHLAEQETETPDPLARTGIDIVYIGLLLASIIAVIILMPVLGFLVTGFIFASFVVVLSGGKWLSALVFSPLATGATYALFAYGLRVPLPRGVWG